MFPNANSRPLFPPPPSHFSRPPPALPPQLAIAYANANRKFQQNFNSHFGNSNLNSNANGPPPQCLIIPPPPVTPQIIANTIRQFQQQNELQQPTTIPSKEAFIFHQQPSQQMPKQEVGGRQHWTCNHNLEQILAEDREKQRAKFDEHLAIVEAHYKEKILQFEKSADLKMASIFRLETHNKMLIEQLEKCKRENAKMIAANVEKAKQQISKEMEQKNNELATKTSMIEGLQKVVQNIREQLSEAKADSSNCKEAMAELEQEIERKNRSNELLTAENEQTNRKMQQIQKEKNEALAQLEEYRQQIRTISEDLNNKFAQQKAQMQAELAQKEVRIRGAIAQLMGGQNHHPLPEIASREIEVEQQQPTVEQPEMIRQNSIDENSLASTTFDESSCIPSNSSILMPSISPNADTIISDRPCTSSSTSMLYNADEPSTSAACFIHDQPPDVEFLEDFKNGPIGPPFKIKREGEEVAEKNWEIIQIDEEDRPWMTAAFRRDNQLFGRVKKEEPADDVNLVEATNQQQTEPAANNNDKNGGGRPHNDEEEVEIPMPRLLRERKRRINYKM